VGVSIARMHGRCAAFAVPCRAPGPGPVHAALYGLEGVPVRVLPRSPRLFMTKQMSIDSLSESSMPTALPWGIDGSGLISFIAGRGNTTTMLYQCVCVCVCVCANIQTRFSACMVAC